MFILFSEVAGHKVYLEQDGDTTLVYLNDVLVDYFSYPETGNLVAENISTALNLLEKEGYLIER